MNQPIDEKTDKIVTEGYRLGHLAIPSGTKWLTNSLENLLEQERKRMSEALTVSLDTSVMLDGWEKYWIDAENCRYIEGCVECGNSKRIK